MPEPVDAAQREAILRSFRERAAAFLGAHTHHDAALNLRFGDRSFALSPWEWRIVRRVMCDGEEPDAVWQGPFCSGIALELAILLAGQTLKRSDANPVALKRAAWEAETVLGLAKGVMDELQQALNALVASGDLDQAKRLTAFRSRLGAALQAARVALAPPEPEAAPHQAAPVPAPAPGQPPAAAASATATEGPTPTPGPAPGTAPPAAPPTSAPQPSHAGETQAAPAAPAPAVPPPETAESPAEAPAAAPNPAVVPYLERAAAFLVERGGADQTTVIPVGARTLKLQTWQRQVLRSAIESGAPTASWQLPVAEATALHLGLLLDLESLDQTEAGAESRPALEASLQATAGLAEGYLELLRNDSNLAVSQGDVNLAKKFTACRTGLQETLREIYRLVDRPAAVPPPAAAARAASPAPAGPAATPVVAEATGQRASASGLAPLEPAAEGASADQPQEEDELTEEEVRSATVVARSIARGRKLAKKRRRQYILLGVLGAVALAWFFIFLFSKPPVTFRPLAMADFQGMPVIQQVVARPPSLYIVVAPQRWQALSASERESTVARIGQTLAGAGYSGAVLKRPDGVVVATWLRSTGVKVLPESGTPPS